MLPNENAFFGRWTLRGAAYAALLLGAAVDPAWAGSFRVNPIHITLPADRQITSLMITNSDTATVSVRVVALAWTQVDGVDVHAPTNNVIASPPIFSIPAGKTQLVRIGLKNRDGVGAYRVIFEEIPLQQPTDGQIRVTLRLDLPMYLLPKDGGKADLRWRAWRDGAGDLFVEGNNVGALHTQVVELSAHSGGSDKKLSTNMGVVLPNSSRVWKIGDGPDLKVGAPFILKVRGPAGETQTKISLDQR